MSGPSETVNRLIHERSPYLLQHAHNPVDWYPWRPEAFEQAVREDKPIFLSIGYSTCHWCHVMAHESFEDPEIADLLNRSFISIKVDREERPDIDQVYMGVCQAMTGHGGWPLTIVMTPERKPFFAATYLPRQSRDGMTGLLDLLPQLEQVWKTRRADIEQFTEELTKALREEAPLRPGGQPGRQLLEKAERALSREFDSQHGGFGTAPKFPAPHQLLLLLRIWDRSRDPRVLFMVEKTLQEMRKGGIFDQVGFGFHRYSVDPGWIVPHFEKMLYDQALLAIAYLEAYQATGNPWYAETAREIFSYVLRDLTAEDGGFYAGQDADSEGVEGKYYLWTWEELERLLDSADLLLFSRFYGLKKQGNIPVNVHGIPGQVNILHQERLKEDIAQEAGITSDELQGRIEKMRSILMQARSGRVPPSRDTKILADWNGLMIAALAMGGRVLDEVRFIHAAERASAAVLGTMCRADGRLNHVYRTDERYIDAFSSDYAAMAWGEIELYESTFDPRHLKTAIGLMEKLATWYRDREGGYYVTPSDQDVLLVRKKEAYDGALPSGNSIAMYNWVRLSSLTGNPDYEERGLRDLRVFSESAEAAPQGYAFLLLSADYLLGPTQQVVINGDSASSDTQEMIRALASPFFPRMTVLLHGGKESSQLEDLAPFLRTYPAPGKKVQVFVCRERRCMPPTNDTGQLMRYLSPSK